MKRTIEMDVFAMNSYAEELRKRGIQPEFIFDSVFLQIPLREEIDITEIDSKIIKTHITISEKGDLFCFSKAAIYGDPEEILCIFHLIERGKKTKKYCEATLKDACNYFTGFSSYLVNARLAYEASDGLKPKREKAKKESTELQELDPLFGSW